MNFENLHTNKPVLLLSEPRKCAGSCSEANLLRSAHVSKLQEPVIILFSTQTQFNHISDTSPAWGNSSVLLGIYLTLWMLLLKQAYFFSTGRLNVSGCLLPSGASHGPCTFHEPSRWCGNHHRSRRLGWALLGSPKGGCCCWVPHHH